MSLKGEEINYLLSSLFLWDTCTCFVMLCIKNWDSSNPLLHIVIRCYILYKFIVVLRYLLRMTRKSELTGPGKSGGFVLHFRWIVDKYKLLEIVVEEEVLVGICLN